MKHEGKETDEMEMKERAKDPKAKDKESKAEGKAAHLNHPQIQAQGHHMMNDMAYHLHHPQIKGGPQGAKMPPSKPKC